MTTLTPLPQFGFLAINGRDAVKFLQGYTTCDVERMTQAQSRIGAICNIKGRMVASALIVRTDEGLLLRLSQDLIGPVQDFLHKYIVFSKAEMADLSTEMSCLGITGDPGDFTDDLADNPGAVARIDSGHVIRIDSDRCELWTDGGVAPPDADTGSVDDWQRADIDGGIAWVCAATADAFIPQMFDYHSIHAVDFDKGCYLGQEIVARMQYRGNVNRKLFKANGKSFTVGDAVTRDGKSIGTVVAASGDVGLAVVQCKEDDAVPEADGLTLEKITRA